MQGNTFKKLLLGSAMACLMTAPAQAGYVNWSGPWASIGIGGIVMNADANVSASRDEQFNVDLDVLGQDILDATLFPLSEQQSLNIDGSSDAGVMGQVALGWDQRLGDSNFLLGVFGSFDFYDVESKFSSQTSATGGAPSIEIGLNPCEAIDGCGEGIVTLILLPVIGASVLNDIRDERIDIEGKVQQDYAWALGGRMGWIWDNTFMTYFGAAWTRTSIDGHVSFNIADPFCGPDSICSSFNSPTSIKLDLDEDVDGYKLMLGGEYGIGHGMGGSWFLRGEAAYADFDGITEVFNGNKSQTLFTLQPDVPANVLVVDVVRQINEQAQASIDKEDYSVHAAIVYKLGGAAPVPVK